MDFYPPLFLPCFIIYDLTCNFTRCAGPPPAFPLLRPAIFLALQARKPLLRSLGLHFPAFCRPDRLFFALRACTSPLSTGLDRLSFALRACTSPLSAGPEASSSPSGPALPRFTQARPSFLRPPGLHESLLCWPGCIFRFLQACGGTLPAGPMRSIEHN